MFDDDRYYTPVALASEFIAGQIAEAPRSCIDSACGTGNLLRATCHHFEDVECFGLDRDRSAIGALRREKPDWILSVGDILRPESYQKTSVVTSGHQCDLLVLNPPFSHNGRKSFIVEFNSQVTKASTAMAHILRGLELFSPRLGGIVVAPESLLFSETDERARGLLATKYEYDVVCELPGSTFRGARARATVLRLAPRSDAQSGDLEIEAARKVADITLIRGSLPVHSVRKTRSGIPYVHSTDMANFKSDPSGRRLIRTSTKAKGKVAGWLVLLPRVGEPKRELISTINVRQPIQLSDCVIALKASSQRKARVVRNIITGAWVEFAGLYRGTGARYTTVKRLKAWLEVRGISVEVK